MRVAVLIIGLILGALMFVQTTLVSMLSGVTEDSVTGGAGVAGWIMALLWLVACALVIAVPLASTILFALAGLIGLTTASGDYKDLAYWAGISLILAVLSLIGWYGKRREARKHDARHAELVAATRGDPPA